MFEVIGWIGSFLFSICGGFQAYTAFKTKSTQGLNTLFIYSWAFGEYFTFAFLLYDNITRNCYQYPLILNYTLNFFVVTYIIYIKIRYK